MDLGMNFDWTVFVLLLGMVFFSIVLVLIVLSKVGTPYPPPSRRRIIIPAPADEKIIEEEGQKKPDPIPNPIPQKKEATYKYALVLVGSHAEIGRFRKIFVEVFSATEDWALVSEASDAGIIFTVVVNPHFGPNPKQNKVVFQCAGWIAKSASTFGDKSLEYLLMSYGDDEKQLFSKAANHIAANLLKEYEAVAGQREN